MVQDRGRFGHQWLGMPASGALDPYAYQMGNVLLGQDRNKAALEITFLGPKLEALHDTEIVITGADVRPKLSGMRIPMWTVVRVREGDVISFHPPRVGCRSYLCVRGGIDVPKVMDSRSTNLRLRMGGLNGRPLVAGDRLRTVRSKRACVVAQGKTLPETFIPTYGPKVVARVILGPQDDFFDEEIGLKTFLESEYQLSPDVNREGFRLIGPAISIREDLPKSIPSEAFPPGGIQVRPNGQPLIVMNDLGGGGYVKIAHVITSDLPKIAQLAPGNKMSFEAIALPEAHRIYMAQEQIFKRLQNNLIAFRLLSSPPRFP